VIFYCPYCWKELPSEQQVCAHCHERISSWDEKAFTDKLLHALSHPEPMTQMRAVYLLGEKRITEAVGALRKLFRRSKNPFLQSEIIEAAGKIGDEVAVSLLMEALNHSSFIVRGEAVRSLTKIPSNGVIKKALDGALEDPSSYVREIGKEARERLRRISEAKGE
jgi:HEAT repeat protein